MLFQIKTYFNPPQSNSLFRFRLQFIRSMIPYLIISILVMLNYFSVSAQSPDQISKGPESTNQAVSSTDISLHLASEEQFIHKTEVSTSSNQEGFIVEQGGSIRIISGESVRLMPGTHIKPGAEVVISTVSSEHLELLAQQAREERKKHTMASILRNSADTTNSDIDAAYILSDYTNTGRRAMLHQMVLHTAVLPARTLTSFAKPLHHAPTGIAHQQIPSHFSDTLTKQSKPSLSWGDRAETIAVIRT